MAIVFLSIFCLHFFSGHLAMNTEEQAINNELHINSNFLSGWKKLHHTHLKCFKYIEIISWHKKLEEHKEVDDSKSRKPLETQNEVSIEQINR